MSFSIQIYCDGWHLHEVPQDTSVPSILVLLRSGGKNCRNTIFIQTVNDLFHPFKMELSLYRFQYCPGKYTKGHFIDFRIFLKYSMSFFQNLRAVKPLFRIVISTVEHFSKIYFSCHMFFSCITGKTFLPSLQGERLFLSFHYLFVIFIRSL